MPYPSLHGSGRAQVCVVGAGITGVLTATLLTEAGIDTVLLEADRIAAGVTGRTTGKVTSQHRLIYSKLDPDTARVYGEANEAGIDLIDELRLRHHILCDFERRPAYVYTSAPGAMVDAVRAEADAATAAGLPAAFVEGDIGLPSTVAGAMRFDDQAQFHPRRFLLALTGLLPLVYEGSPVTHIGYGRPCRVETAAGVILADYVVLATHMPFGLRGGFYAKAFPYRSYVLASRISGDDDLPGMYISADEPTHSLRTAPFGDERVLLTGGEGHRVGSDASTDVNYARLEMWTRETFPGAELGWQWSTQDLRSADGLPFIGPLASGRERIMVATAFGKWGMTNGAVSAMLLRDRIRGIENPWTHVFDSQRLWRLARSAGTLVAENATTARRLVDGNLGMHRRHATSSDALQPGDGAVIGGSAVYRDIEGGIHSVSAHCTHMGCVVEWNDAEASWDCPCHGSRFDVDGAVLEGPATRPLARSGMRERAA